MLFNSYSFVFLFFPLCIMGFYICRKIGEKTGKDWLPKAFLLLFSLWFYGFSGPENLPALLLSMAVNYGIYLLMGRAGQKKPLLAAGLILNVGALFCFKYTGFSYAPPAVSFFTFSQIAFLMECYRGTLGKVSALDYSVYVTFFPKLMEGPIALPDEMLSQIRKITDKKFDWEKMFRGFSLFTLGLAKKALIADTLGKAADFGYANPASLNSGDALIVMLSYTLQLYFDFSGYCDMAMGAAECLGFELPLNFNSPYRAGNIIEFWKGWHITLTRFFTRYFYIPLGGNRKGRARTYLNTLLVFLVSGIWHGKGLTFLVWGMMHGLLYVAARWYQERRKGRGEEHGFGRGAGKKVGRALSVFATFLYVNIAWVFFRAPSVKDALALLKTVLGCNFARISRNLADCFQLDEFWYVIKVLHIDGWQYAHYILMVVMLLFALLLVFFARTAVAVSGEIKPTVVNAALLALLFVWCVVTFSEVSTFLYFNF